MQQSKLKQSYLFQLLPLCLSVFIFFLLTSCCSETKPKTTLILDWLPNPNHVPLYVGLEMGYFEEEGIDLLILKAPDVIDASLYTLSGQCDLAVTYCLAAIKAQEKGVPIQVVGKLIDHTLGGIIYTQDGTIKKPQDLSGKRLGFCVDGADSKLPYLLDSNGIEPKSSHNCHFDLTGMLLSGQVDMLYGAFTNIETHQLNAHGHPCDYFTLEELGVPSYPELVIIAKEGNNHAPFQRALQKSLNFCRDNSEIAFTLYCQSQHDKGEETIAWEKLAWESTHTLLPSSQEIDPIQWNSYRDYLLCHNSTEDF